MKLQSSVRQFLGQSKTLRHLRERWMWDRNVKAFSAFVERGQWAPSSVNSSSDEVMVVIQPWMLTPFPWFAVTFALGLRQRGRKVCLVWDDTDFGGTNATRSYLQETIQKVLNDLPSTVEYIQLSKIEPVAESSLSLNEIERLAELNTVQHFRGEAEQTGRKAYHRIVTNDFQRTARHIQAVFQTRPPAYVAVPGGIYGSSSLFVQLGQKLGLRVATFDSGFEILLTATDGVAAHLADIPRALQILPEDEWIVAEAKSELERRMAGKDTFSSQVSATTGEREQIGVLIPLNQSFDTAALGRHRIFANQTEWMVETTRWILEHTSDNVVIRQHPVERHDWGQGTDNYQQVLAKQFGQHPRLRFIGASATANTYDLIASAKVIVPNTSTVGVEAAALGKCVVSQGGSYYSEMGFMWSADNPEAYFGYLKQALNGELAVSETQRTTAYRCLYLTQRCNFHRTVFTPQPSDFAKWVKESPQDLLSKQSVIDVFDAIDHNRPLSIINHQRRAEAINND